jgi:plastocyanin
MPSRLSVAASIAYLFGGVLGVQAATTITVAQHGLTFLRSSVALTKGDRIVFTNQDDVLHNIHIFGAADERDLGLQKPGATLSYTFDKAGLFTVRCNIHPSVRMAVSVK